MKLILASTSKYRKKLLQEAGFDVACIAPDYDEKALENLAPIALVAHHSRQKALSLCARYPDDLIIGSDQALIAGDTLYGKPGTFEVACRQLQSLRGKTAILATGVAVVHRDQVREAMNLATLYFRDDLTDGVIEAYVRADLPLDCAGSFKIEARGARLFSAIETTDPTAIQGIPILQLNRLLVDFCPEFDRF